MENASPPRPKRRGFRRGEPMTKAISHKVDLKRLLNLVAWHIFACEKTVDNTQVKNLEIKVGMSMWRVQRRYINVPPGDSDWEIVYEGADPAEAVRMYNGLG